MHPTDQSTDPTRVTIAGTPASLQLAVSMVNDIVCGHFKGFALLRQLTQRTGQHTIQPQPVYVEGYGFVPLSQVRSMERELCCCRKHMASTVLRRRGRVFARWTAGRPVPQRHAAHGGPAKVQPAQPEPACSAGQDAGTRVAQLAVGQRSVARPGAGAQQPLSQRCSTQPSRYVVLFHVTVPNNLQSHSQQPGFRVVGSRRGPTPHDRPHIRGTSTATGLKTTTSAAHRPHRSPPVGCTLQTQRVVRFTTTC